MRPEHRNFWGMVSVTRWQIPTRVLLLAVVILAGLLAAAFILEGRSAAVRELPPATGSRAEPLANGQYRFVPGSARVSVGERYRFRLYTHCGLNNPVAVDFDGSFWDPTGESAASGGGGNPPAGFGNPFDDGVMTLVSPVRARYLSRSGTVILFSRHPGPRVSPPCS